MGKAHFLPFEDHLHPRPTDSDGSGAWSDRRTRLPPTRTMPSSHTEDSQCSRFRDAAFWLGLGRNSKKSKNSGPAVVDARHNLGCMEGRAKNYDLALQHWMISATLRHEKSLSKVKTSFMKGLANKADYAAALRGYQNAVEEISSPDRDEANSLGLDEMKKI